MKIAVIENEYGAVSIDTALVEENVREVRDGGWRRKHLPVAIFSLWAGARGAQCIRSACGVSWAQGGLHPKKYVVRHE